MFILFCIFVELHIESGCPLRCVQDEDGGSVKLRVYALTINAEKGEVNVCGEVDPNLLVKALKGTGKHAEIVHVKLKHPSLTTPTTHYRPSYNGYGHGYHGLGYGYGHGHSYGYSRGHDYYNTMPMSPYNYSMRRSMMMEQPHYYGHHASSYPR
ncbi:hypothetical protein MTR67_040509 [Solanum verrucosum]|uniref:HMA domain-containing protein n=1 Tax=Solanum verrucosum TaxID=315347 RepID=A0AAF0UJP9_SOLVR|nr:hypothetical protein MTR67_040509 [Solanum verrucosum]